MTTTYHHGSVFFCSDSNYQPISEEDESLGDEDFIMPEEPLEQEHFKRQLIATARSLKKKQLQLQADQDMLNDRWTEVLATEEYGLSGPAKSYPKRRLLPQFDDEALEPVPQLGPDKAATQAEHQTTPPRYKSMNKTGRGRTYDLRQD